MLETILQPDDENERCGFLLKDGTIVEITNVATEPRVSYEMDAAEALPYIEAGTVAATWHTHPDGDANLSGDDYEGFLRWPDLDHYVIGRAGDDVIVRWFHVDDGLVIACD